jgi:hypothetical protein
MVKAEVEVSVAVFALLLGRSARANKRKEGRNGLRFIGKVQLSLRRATMAGPHADSLDMVCRSSTL